MNWVLSFQFTDEEVKAHRSSHLLDTIKWVTMMGLLRSSFLFASPAPLVKWGEEHLKGQRLEVTGHVSKAEKTRRANER